MKQIFKVTDEIHLLLYSIKSVASDRDQTYIWNIILQGEYTKPQRRVLNLKRTRYLKELEKIYKERKPIITATQK